MNQAKKIYIFITVTKCNLTGTVDLRMDFWLFSQKSDNRIKLKWQKNI